MRPGFVLLVLGLLALVGCQAETTDLATATLAPAGAESQATLAPTVEVVATATSNLASPTAPTDEEIGESEMSDEATPAETEVGPGSDGPVGDGESKTGKANADIEYVRASQSAGGSWTFQVTVRHPDTGWEDYADGWDVVTPDGQVLKTGPDERFTRLLLHPHENEQPFTRSQSGIVVPEGVTMVTVRAHDLVGGFGGRQVTVDLTVSSGPDFEVKRQ